MAVKRRWGFVQTECNFSLLLLHGRAGCVINCSRQRGIYEQVQMEVTSDLSRGVRRALKPQDCGAFRQAASLFLISSNWILFPKCGINHPTSGKCVGSVPEIARFLPFPSFSSRSRLEMSAVCRSIQPSGISWMPAGAAEVICQAVSG